MCSALEVGSAGGGRDRSCHLLKYNSRNTRGVGGWPTSAFSKGQGNADVPQGNADVPLGNADVPQFHVGLGNPGVVLAVVVCLCYSINDSGWLEAVLWKNS